MVGLSSGPTSLSLSLRAVAAELCLSTTTKENNNGGEKENNNNGENLVELVEGCARELRRNCVLEEGAGVPSPSPPPSPLPSLHLRVVLPALKAVVQDLVEQQEVTCAAMREEIRRLEAEKCASEVAAREVVDAAREEEEVEEEEEEVEVGALERELLGVKRALSEVEEVVGERERELSEVQRALSEAVELLEEREGGYRRMCEENRALHEMVKELRGNMLVFGRVRPRGVTGDGSACVVRARPEECALECRNKHGDWKRYRFDRVFGEDSTQEDVYFEAKSLVRSVMRGTDVTIFAYGQTGSGKTHTMQYLNRRALEDLFGYQREDEAESARRYRFRVQMLEIYNEQINDMLEPGNTNLKVQTMSFRTTNEDSMTRVPDARIVGVERIEDVVRILEQGTSNRHVGATKMNERSSRSHLVFTVMVERMEESGEVVRGRLHLIDLAGSERLARSGAEGARATETRAINLSLSTLGRVLGGIAANQRHVAFRDSKITQLLEDSLTGGKGKSKCMMFMHVAPEMPSGQETRSTLEFAKGVAEHVVVNK